ncbi:MAG: hypothetical protein N2449_09595 [Bacteroidales bacterium]|nr:hypothetical protein [Bacteroidales bacterium]
MNIKIFIFLIALIVLHSCKSENEEEFFHLSANDSLRCDTLYVTYSRQIKPMFDIYCTYCHINEMVPGCDLDNYEHTVNYIMNTGTKLYDYVKNNNHQGVVLDTCSLKQLKKWVLNPAP